MLKRVLAPIEFSSQYSYSPYRYEGEGFTGIEYRIDKGGRIIEEQSYFEGMRWGFSRSWRDNDTLRDEYFWKHDGTNGNCRKSYLNGQLKEQSFREESILIWRKRWNKEGELIEEFNLESEPENEMYNLWKSRQSAPEQVKTPEMLEYERRGAKFEQEISDYLAKYPSDKIYYDKNFIEES